MEKRTPASQRAPGPKRKDRLAAALRENLKRRKAKERQESAGKAPAGKGTA